jgi:hypothetical protein
MTTVRSNPSGTLVTPPFALGSPNYSAAAPLVMELEPLGHAPGMYEIVITHYVETVAGSGSVIVTIEYTPAGANSPNVNTVGTFGITVANSNLNALRNVLSSGASAIRLVYTPTGVGGAVPRLLVACTSLSVALPVAS